MCIKTLLKKRQDQHTVSVIQDPFLGVQFLLDVFLLLLLLLAVSCWLLQSYGESWGGGVDGGEGDGTLMLMGISSSLSSFPVFSHLSPLTSSSPPPPPVEFLLQTAPPLCAANHHDNWSGLLLKIQHRSIKEIKRNRNRNNEKKNFLTLLLKRNG